MNRLALTAPPRRTDILVIGLLTIGITLVGIVASVVGTQFVRTSGAVPRMTLSDLTRYADVIVTARVVGQSKEVRQPQGSQRGPVVLTHTTLSVLARHKGSPESQIVVTTQGGRSGSVFHVVDHQPTFSNGDRIIVFLYTAPRDGTYATVGAFQGRFVVRGNVASNGDSELEEQKLIDAIAQGR